MRTKIFRRFSELVTSEQFLKEFSIFWNIAEEELVKLIPYAAEAVDSRLAAKSQRAVEEALRTVKVPTPEALAALRILQVLWSFWNRIEDSAESVYRDLNDLGLIPAEKEQLANRILAAIVMRMGMTRDTQLKQDAADSLLPSLATFDAVIDHRAVFDREYETGEDPKKFEPKLLGFASVLIFRITRDTGVPREFEFQCSPEDLKLMSAELQTLMTKLQISQSAIDEVDIL